MIGALADFLALAVPSQFLPLVCMPFLGRTCNELSLPAPATLAGNVVIGNLASARYVLSAHVDQASFHVIWTSEAMVRLAACHRYVARDEPDQLRLVGVRNDAAVNLGESELIVLEDGFFCENPGGILLGDHAVYLRRVSVSGQLLTASAVDDRVGAVIALFAASALHASGIPVAVVLSDGEQNLPQGYFSRTFPQVLSRISPDTIVIFIDGIFEGLKREGRSGPESGALIVPHSADGMGYTVPPKLFARLRDEIVPTAQSRGVDVRVSAAYHSRGDDWGLVTNPTSGYEHEAFFVSFGGGGDSPAHRILDTRCLDACLGFLLVALPLLRQEQ